MNLGKNLIYATILFILLNNCSKSPTEPEPLSPGTILFIHGNVEVNEICTMKPDGSEIKIIATAPPRIFLPVNYSWARLSPDGNTLIVQGGIRESLEYDPLYIMDTEGNILYKLTWNGDRT